MERPGKIALVLLLAIVTVIGTLRVAPGLGRAPAVQAQDVQSGPTLEWFGWSHFRITSANGKIFHTNPFINGNPDASIRVEDITRADFLLIPNGHRDEVGDTILIAHNTGARVLAGGFEMGSWFIQQGLPAEKVMRSNPGNRHNLDGVIVRVVSSVHGSGLPAPTLENPYGGPAAGFMITLEDGFTIYFAGSSAATMDMQLWGSAFKPDLAILPLNGDRDPIDVAQMVKLISTDNPNLATVIPHHQRVEPPPGATTIDQMEEAIRTFAGSPVEVLRLERGRIVQLKKH